VTVTAAKIVRRGDADAEGTAAMTMRKRKPNSSSSEFQLTSFLLATKKSLFPFF